jgi:hypothetical protein
MRLPPAFDAVDIGEWATTTVEQATSEGLELPPAAMLVYSRRGVDRYDEIAERVAAVVPVDPAGGLVGRRTMRAHDERARLARSPAELREVLIEQNLLSHRPIDLAIMDGRLRYELSGDDIVFTDLDSLAELRFAISYPPTMIREPSVVSEQPEPMAWFVQDEMAGLWWMPLPLLIEYARFERWQEARPDLVRHVAVGQLPLFVSHRWLSTGEPDPDGRHARLLAWQLVATLCEAVFVATSRGLHEPARTSPILGRRIGIGGSELAEAMIVAMLRRTLDDEAFEMVRNEAITLEAVYGRDVVAVADEDVGLSRLRESLADRPVLRYLTGNITLWVDYSCLPQPPRSPDEQEEFVAGLHLLGAAQLLGRTVIVLDDVEDYSGRAWCLLETLTANRLAGIYDVLSGRPEAVDPGGGGPYQHLSNLLLDLPYVVWRALLDAEVFAEISWQECLERLELAVTDPADLRYIYERLLDIPGPNRLHTSIGDLVTGVLPVPLLDDGSVLVPASLGRAVDGPEPRGLGSLPWSAALSLSTDSEARPFDAGSDQLRTPFVRWPDRDVTKGAHCHLAIVASNEAEAILLVGWVERHVAALEQLANVTFDSRSWLAVDVAPVGTLANGLLTSVAIEAANWLILTTSTRRNHCPVTAAVSSLAIEAGVALAWALVDVEDGDNVIAMGDAFPALARSERPQPDSTRVVATSARHPVHLGGLYRRDLVELLMESDHA